MCKVLVVDDNEGLRTALGIALTRRGHEVDLAAGATQALAELAQRRHDWAVLDMRMPGMSGLDLAREMRRLRPDTRVVLMSSYEPPDDATLREIGAVGFLEKPFEIERLCSVMQEGEQHCNGYESARSRDTRPDAWTEG